MGKFIGKAILLIGFSLWTMGVTDIVGAYQDRGQRVQLKPDGNRPVTLYSGSYALVIGVSRYTNGWTNLPGVSQDVQAVREALGLAGFMVEVVNNPTREQFDLAIRKFISIRGAGESNRLVIYFAGHGHTIKTRDGRELGYLIPANSPLPNLNLTNFKETAIGMNEIENYALQIESKHALFVFDSCFSGSLFEAINRATPAVISEKTLRPVRLFITAGESDQKVPDQSLFRKQFVTGLAGAADLDRDGYVTGSELGMFLTNTVTNYSKQTQTPRWGTIRDPRLDKGDIVFEVGKKSESLTITSSGGGPPVEDPETEAWALVRESRRLSDVEAFLEEFPNGRYAAAGRIKKRQLEAEMNAPPSVHSAQEIATDRPSLPKRNPKTEVNNFTFEITSVQLSGNVLNVEFNLVNNSFGERKVEVYGEFLGTSSSVQDEEGNRFVKPTVVFSGKSSYHYVEAQIPAQINNKYRMTFTGVNPKMRKIAYLSIGFKSWANKYEGQFSANFRDIALP
ncbi:MAG TPA: caspase family protein [Acidobacteriota bacterium]|nr:caspase family protein [Acidobacteriota bacterium]